MSRLPDRPVVTIQIDYELAKKVLDNPFKYKEALDIEVMDKLNKILKA